MIFFDSSAVVPIFFIRHVHHLPSWDLYENSDPATRCLSAHSLAEIFNSSTRPSGGVNASTARAQQVLQVIKREFLVVNLKSEDYMAAVDMLVSRNLGGPLIYDALLLQCARKVNAQTIYTWNVRHFQRLAPDLAERIRTP